MTTTIPLTPGRPLRLGSLFSGYGGLDLAVQQVFAADPVWFAENDPVVARVYESHWPGAVPLGDITTVDWARVPPVDVVAGGFPCQDLSSSGRQAGMTPGTRSGLWAAMAHAISILKPAWVVVENVPGLLSTTAHPQPEDTHDHTVTAISPAATDGISPTVRGARRGKVAGERGLGVVLADLARLGMDAAWVCLPASSAGAIHLRRRVFLLAWPAAANTLRV